MTVVRIPNHIFFLKHLVIVFILNLAISSSPAKPRSASKYEPSNGARTVGPSSGLNIPRRSTTIYEKNASNEKTNVTTDTAYVFLKFFYISF